MPKELNGGKSKSSKNISLDTTILLVDDDPNIGAAIHRFFQNFFGEEEYRMFQTSTVSEALTYLNQEKIDLIITDLQLMEYSGVSLLVRMRAKSKQVPIIVMSAYTNFMSEEDWKLLGAQEFIPKPPDLSLLREVLSRVLKKDGGELQS